MQHECAALAQSNARFERAQQRQEAMQAAQLLDAGAPEPHAGSNAAGPGMSEEPGPHGEHGVQKWRHAQCRWCHAQANLWSPSWCHSCHSAREQVYKVITREPCLEWDLGVLQKAADEQPASFWQTEQWRNGGRERVFQLLGPHCNEAGVRFAERPANKRALRRSAGAVGVRQPRKRPRSAAANSAAVAHGSAQAAMAQAGPMPAQASRVEAHRSAEPEDTQAVLVAIGAAAATGAIVVTGATAGAGATMATVTQDKNAHCMQQPVKYRRITLVGPCCPCATCVRVRGSHSQHPEASAAPGASAQPVDAGLACNLAGNTHTHTLSAQPKNLPAVAGITAQPAEPEPLATSLRHAAPGAPAAMCSDGRRGNVRAGSMERDAPRNDGCVDGCLRMATANCAAQTDEVGRVGVKSECKERSESSSIVMLGEPAAAPRAADRDASVTSARTPVASLAGDLNGSAAANMQNSVPTAAGCFLDAEPCKPVTCNAGAASGTTAVNVSSNALGDACIQAELAPMS